MASDSDSDLTPPPSSPSAGSDSMPNSAPPPSAPPPVASSSKRPKKAAKRASETPSASATGSRRSSRVAASSRSSSPEKRDASQSETATPTSMADAPTPASAATPASRSIKLKFKRPSPVKEDPPLPAVQEEAAVEGQDAKRGNAKGKKRKTSLAKSHIEQETTEEEAGSAKRAKTTHAELEPEPGQTSHKGRVIKRKAAARTSEQDHADFSFLDDDEEPAAGPSQLPELEPALPPAPVLEPSRGRGSKAIKPDPAIVESPADKVDVENQDPVPAPAPAANRKASKKKGYGSSKRTILSDAKISAEVGEPPAAEPEDDDLFVEKAEAAASTAIDPPPPDTASTTTANSAKAIKGKKKGSKVGKVAVAPPEGEMAMDVDRDAASAVQYMSASSSKKGKGQGFPSAETEDDAIPPAAAPAAKPDVPLTKKKSFAEAVTGAGPSGTSSPAPKEKRPIPIPAISKIAKVAGGGTPGSTAASAFSTPSAANKKPVVAPGHKKPTATPSTAPKAAPSLLESTMATLKAVNAGTLTTKDGKGPAKPPAKPLAKGEWADEWVPSQQERKEIDASRPQREAERAKRMAWRKNPVNLQEAHDAYRLDATIPRVIPPVEFGGLGIKTEGAPSKMVAALLAQRAQATSS